MEEEENIIVVGLHNRDSSLLTDVSESKPTINKNKSVSEIVTGKFNLPELPYTNDALEPYIDRATMEIHHDKHHSAYVSNLNKEIESLKNGLISIEEIIKNIGKENYSLAIRNNAGGHYNDSLFWKLMKADGGGTPTGKLLEEIKKSFGSFDDFKIKFSDVATKIFGSGWAWLVLNNGKLEIGITPNQDNPLMDISSFKGTPVLCLDVWEHAYYLKYQNRRADYIKGWWNVVNWDEVTKNLKNANKQSI
jgi:Fe-Mn family superoxide dismutase